MLLSLGHLYRWWLWGPWQARHKPILWVLYMGYLWIPIGFMLHMAAQLGWVMSSLALHAFTTGGFGVLILGMISRVSLGHTGRPIHASPLIVLSYLTINLAAVLRVFWPLLQVSHYPLAITLSGVLWVLAFVFFVIYYSPILLRPRADGRPG